MSAAFRVDGIRFNRAPRALRESGLLGFVRVRLDGRWIVDGITVRETADRRHAIAFPAKTDGSGIQRPFFRANDLETRDQIENEILRQLRSEGVLG